MKLEIGNKGKAIKTDTAENIHWEGIKGFFVRERKP